MVILTKKNAILACLVGLIVLLGLATSPHATKAAYSELDSMTYREFMHDVSDDERYVVYYREKDEDKGLYWLDLQTGERRLLIDYEAQMYIDLLKLRIAPNNDYVFVQHTRTDTLKVSLRKVRVSDGQSTDLLSNYNAIDLPGAAFYPDGTRMVIELKDQLGVLKLSSHDLATPVMRLLPLPPQLNHISRFFLQPDGEGVVVHAVGHGELHGLYRTTITAGTAFPLHPYSALPIESPALSLDGQTLYYFVRQSESAIQLTRTRLGESPTAIGSAGMLHGSIQFSPDGRYAFYPQRIANQGSVFRLTLADDTLLPLHSTPIYFANDDHLGITVPTVGNRILIAEADGGSSDANVRLLSVAYDPPAPAQELTTLYGVNQFNQKIPLLVTDDAQTVIFTDPEARSFYLNRVAMDGSTPAQRLYPDPAVGAVRLSQSSTGLFVHVILPLTSQALDEIYYVSLTESTPTPRLLYRTPKPIDSTAEITMHGVTAGEQVFFTTVEHRSYSPYFLTELMLANPTPAAQFALPELTTVSEGTTRTLTVELMPSSATTETVGYEVIGGTATLGKDFTLSPAELVFAPGQVSQTLTVTALSDVAPEGLETATLQLTGIETQPYPTMTLSFNEFIGISAAPAHLATTSEDGRYVIFHEQQAAGVGLYSYDLLTKTRTELHTPDGTMPFEGEAFLSPDSQTVLYGTATGMRQVPRTGGNTVSLGTIDCPAKVVFSTTAPYALLHHICTIPNESPLYQVDLTAATATPLMPNAFDLGAGAVAPDGNAAIYLDSTDEAEPRAYLISTISGAMQPLNLDLNGAYFTAPTTALLIGSNGIAALLDSTSGIIAPLIDLDTHETDRTMRYSPRRHSLYYINSRFELTRYQIGAAATEKLGILARPWMNLSANEDQLIYREADMPCIPNGCTPRSYYTKAMSLFTGEDLWLSDHIAAANAIAMQPNRRGVVYATFNFVSRSVSLYYKNLYSDTPEQLLPSVISARNGSAFLVGNASVYSIAGTTLQSTRLTENSPVITHFRDALPPTLTRLVGEDVLLFNDAQGYLYAIADPAPRVAFATSPDVLAAEGETITITLSLESTPLTTATVSIEVMGGTVTSGTDVNAPPATLTFAPFQREASFTLTLAADGSSEPVETLDLRVTPLSGASLGDVSTFRLRLADTLYRRYFPAAQRSR